MFFHKFFHRCYHFVPLLISHPLGLAVAAEMAVMGHALHEAKQGGHHEEQWAVRPAVHLTVCRVLYFDVILHRLALFHPLYLQKKKEKYFHLYTNFYFQYRKTTFHGHNSWFGQMKAKKREF